MHIEKGLSLEYFQDIFLNIILSRTLCHSTDYLVDDLYSELVPLVPLAETSSQ